MKLDSRTIAGLRQPPAGKIDVVYFDDDLPGFGLRLRASGKRTWIVQYRVAGLSRRLTIGGADVLNVTEARKRARKALAQALTGSDPADERRSRHEKTKVTLRSIAENYLQFREGKIRTRSMVEARRYLTSPSYFGPLHALPVERIERRHVADQIMHVEGARGAATAGRARSALSALFSWGMRTGLCDRNPVIGSYTPDAPLARDRVLSDEEIVAVWRACGDDDFGRIVKLLILTGARRTEIGGLCWHELDHASGVWTLPAERSKNHRSHMLPLPSLAWDIVEGTPRLIGRDHVFGDRSAKGFTSWRQAKTALDARLSASDWNLHDLRRSMATGLANLGTQPHVIESILNHQSGHKRGPAGIYNRSTYQAEMCSALGLWSSHIEALVAGGARKVVPMRSSIPKS